MRTLALQVEEGATGSLQKLEKARTLPRAFSREHSPVLPGF